MKLKDICEFIVDCPHSTAKDEGEGYPLIRTPNIGKGRLLLDGVHRVSEEVYQSRISRGIPSKNDLILAREAPIGNVAIIKNEGRICLGQRTVLLRPDKNCVNPDFLMYYLISPEQQGKLIGSSNGATVNHLNMVNIRNLDVNIPCLKVQSRIASILSAYDDLIENNQKQIKLLEEVAQRLYKEWFVELRFPGYENTEIVDGLSVGWECKKLSELGTVITGKTPSTSNEGFYGNYVPFVKIPDMHNKIFPLNVETYLSEEGANSQKGKYLPPNALLISCIGTVGLINITVEKCQTNQQINALILSNEKILYYMYYYLKGLQGLLQGLGSNGATMTNVNKNKLERILIKIPRYDLLERFFDFCEPIFNKILLLSKENISLKEARDRLLPKLMSGEVEV